MKVEAGKRDFLKPNVLALATPSSMKKNILYGGDYLRSRLELVSLFLRPSLYDRRFETINPKETNSRVSTSLYHSSLIRNKTRRKR